MKILEINKFYFAKGGADKHFLDVVELLESNGHEVAVFSMKSPNNLPSRWEKYFVSTVGYTLEYSLMQKIKGAGRMFYSLEAKRKINKLLDEFQPDIVHIHNIYHQLSPCILFEIKKREIPIVMTVHDYKLINPNHNLYHEGLMYNRCRKGKFYQCFLDKCIKNSYAKSFLAMLEMYWHEWLGTYRKNIDAYIAPSNFVKNILTEWGIDEKRITTLPHFLIEKGNNIYKPQKNSENYALYFGRISKEKGVQNLIDIFQNIQSIKLYLIGSIEDGLRINEQPNIKHIEHLSQEKLKNYIRNAAFVVSGSKLPETFGLIAVEANHCGQPFIGFQSGAYQEIIENNINGYLVENREEMKKVIKKILNKEIRFDSEKIKTTAHQKYNCAQYYLNLMQIFKKAAK